MFNYKIAFQRNIGWVTEEEQEKISRGTIAVGGLGGVGGDEILGLARMGFQKFHIADLDTFDLSNFNRQAGATIHNIGKTKVSVLSDQLKAINPNIEIKIFPKGITENSIDDFLDGVDIYVDSLDLFALHARSLVFEKAYQKNIPALTAAPLAMGVSFLCFLPEKMSFQEYFGISWPNVIELKSLPRDSKEKMKLYLSYYGNNIIKLLAGLAPSAMQRKYLVNSTAVNVFTKDVPSFKPGIDLASGVMCSNVLKVFLGRGPVVIAPKCLQFDAYLNRYKISYRPFGKNNPLFLITQWIIKKLIHFDGKYKNIGSYLDKSDQILPKEINDKVMYDLLSKI